MTLHPPQAEPKKQPVSHSVLLRRGEENTVKLGWNSLGGLQGILDLPKSQNSLLSSGSKVAGSKAAAPHRNTTLCMYSGTKCSSVLLFYALL